MQPNAIEAHRPGAVSPPPLQQQAPSSGVAWPEEPALAQATTPSGHDVDSAPGWLPASTHSHPTGSAGAMRAPGRPPYQLPGSPSACVLRSADAAALGGSCGRVLDSSGAGGLDSSEMPETDAEGANAQHSHAAAVGISRVHGQDWGPDDHQPDGPLEHSPATSHLSNSSGGGRRVLMQPEAVCMFALGAGQEERRATARVLWHASLCSGRCTVGLSHTDSACSASAHAGIAACQCFIPM